MGDDHGHLQGTHWATLSLPQQGEGKGENKLEKLMDWDHLPITVMDKIASNWEYYFN